MRIGIKSAGFYHAFIIGINQRYVAKLEVSENTICFGHKFVRRLASDHFSSAQQIT
jgi:hypothetical protein